MEMLVTKFSKGKYRNESELFAEPVSADNVKLMGEMIALQALRTVKKYDMKIADRLYIGLIKDLHHMGEVDYIVSEGYDCVQTAICFLYQFKGRKVSEIYGKDWKGKEITIPRGGQVRGRSAQQARQTRKDRIHRLYGLQSFAYGSRELFRERRSELRQDGRTYLGVTFDGIGACHFELLHERNGTVRNMRGTRDRQRKDKQQKSKHPSEVLCPVRRALIYMPFNFIKM